MRMYIQTFSAYLITQIIFTVSGNFSTRMQVHVDKGDIAILPCQTTLSVRIAQWLRLPQDPTGPSNTYSDGETVNKDLPFKERISISRNCTSGVYNLQIINATSMDSGIYRCVLVAENRARKLDVLLVVKELLISSTDEIIIRNLTATSDNETNAKAEVLSLGFTIDIIIKITAIPCISLLLSSFITTLYVYVRTTRSRDVEFNQNEREEQLRISNVAPQQSDNVGPIIYEPINNLTFNGDNFPNHIASDRRTINNDVYHLVPFSNETTQSQTVDNSGHSNLYQSLTDNWSDYTHAYREYTPKNN